MQLSRRSVLFGLIAAPIVVRPGLLMPVRVDVPWIVGDGVHDDAPGLQALIDGGRYKVSRSFVGHASRVDGAVRINGGRFLLSKGLDVRGEFNMKHSYLIGADTADYALMFHEKPTGCVRANFFDFMGSRTRAAFTCWPDGDKASIGLAVEDVPS
jgi:hypothetical protein